MKIYNKEKNEIIENPDLEKGYLTQDTLTIHHKAIEGIAEQFHYEVIKEYPNGGKDVEKVVDVKGVEPHDAYDEIQNIYIYNPYTKEELQRIKNSTEISKINVWFEKYDMQVKEYERDVRLGNTPSIHIDDIKYSSLIELDLEAKEKASRLKELRD